MYDIMVKDFMIRKVKYIWPTISYRFLKNILKKNKHLRSFPLVDSPEHMILLGSVKRSELIKMIEKHIGRDRRLEVAAKWQKEVEDRAREQYLTRYSRRPSRFEMEQTTDVAKLREIANNEMLPPQAKKTKETLLHPSLDVLPRRSILKKTHSFNFRRHSITFRVSATLNDIAPDQRASEIDLDSSVPTEIISFSPYVSKKVYLVCSIRYEMIRLIKTVFFFSSRMNVFLTCRRKIKKFGKRRKWPSPLIWMAPMLKLIHHHSNWWRRHRSLKFTVCFR